jgi:hypothetical protein
MELMRNGVTFERFRKSESNYSIPSTVETCISRYVSYVSLNYWGFNKKRIGY